MRIRMEYIEKVPDKTTQDGYVQKSRYIDKDISHIRITLHGLGEFNLETLESIALHNSLYEKSQQSKKKIIALSAFFLALDIVLFFAVPFLIVGYFNLNIGFSPIPIGATISICGIQAGWVAALFYQYKEESMKAAYIFKGGLPYPRDQ